MSAFTVVEDKVAVPSLVEKGRSKKKDREARHKSASEREKEK